eukprot:CAMPEP_0203767354 /NCGR_PEP_ID=MMETSP0099_2-20121227/951_1 /ASSEMBLY_ACC=CAM_ASM_000209 /TAXON_ID=96639 /ORGANISM=" , Strain NY0313808BC1" /LENGTH=37 /DNA_ID= /DNA_START= /DNA_END= /DNA_ORIENTATION=
MVALHEKRPGFIDLGILGTESTVYSHRKSSASMGVLS